MKKLYFFLAFFCFLVNLNAQTITIPDTQFKWMLLIASSSNSFAKDLSGNYFKIDANNNGEIEVAEAIQVSYLNLSCMDGCASVQIHNLTGLTYFTNLRYLDCRNQLITTIPTASLSQLETLICYNNPLGTLNLSGLVNLKNLNCQTCQLS